MDECWMDVTGSSVYGNGVEIAEKIRRSCREELGLTVSIGVSYNKIFAKLGSDLKKPDAITEIRRDTYQEQIWPLDCSEMIYCGRATTAKLAKARRAERFVKNPTPSAAYPFTGLLVCANCGKNYRRKVTKGGPVWICSTFNTLGKAACASK